mmetsp:Transcript_6346/g.21249  ORF Transcript_6346/g.21249 Transcript_6346/m.21249 type:complete len:294 (-) Transcript_6346:1-882(-)
MSLNRLEGEEIGVSLRPFAHELAHELSKLAILDVKMVAEKHLRRHEHVPAHRLPRCHQLWGALVRAHERVILRYKSLDRARERRLLRVRTVKVHNLEVSPEDGLERWPRPFREARVRQTPRPLHRLFKLAADARSTLRAHRRLREPSRERPRPQLWVRLRRGEITDEQRHRGRQSRAPHRERHLVRHPRPRTVPEEQSPHPVLSIQHRRTVLHKGVSNLASARHRSLILPSLPSRQLNTAQLYLLTKAERPRRICARTRPEPMERPHAEHSFFLSFPVRAPALRHVLEGGRAF